MKGLTDKIKPELTPINLAAGGIKHALLQTQNIMSIDTSMIIIHIIISTTHLVSRL